MPLYEYNCPKCNKTIEVIQKFSDAPLDVCPDCGGPVSKLLSRTSFQLKGGGWYATDYKKSKPEEKKPKPSEKASGSGSTGGGSSTPES